MINNCERHPKHTFDKWIHCQYKHIDYVALNEEAVTLPTVRMPEVTVDVCFVRRGHTHTYELS